MWNVLSKFRHLLLLCLAFIGCVILSGIFVRSGTASAAVISQQQAKVSACRQAAVPNEQSLLVVMLDRSGSLVVQPGATDPDGYSTSVTKVLTELWPGPMLFIPFSKNQTPAYGPYTLSDPAQRTQLQQTIDTYAIGGETPLGQAMHQALDHLTGASPGSRAIIITDGQPNTADDPGGPRQSQDIRDHLIQQFCDLGIPVKPFGLSLDPNTNEGKTANALLNDIAIGTGTTYTDVQGPKDLAREVIRLYAEWQGLNFEQVDTQGGNFPVSIDSFAKQVRILAFRSGETDQPILDGPNGQPVQGVQSSIDKHYIIYALTQGVFVAGNYIVHTEGDPDAQVYVLVNSPLQVKITAPTVLEQPYGQTLEIEASFFDGANILTPDAGQAQLIAHVSLLVRGQQVGPTNDIVLVSQGASFRGHTQLYNQAGTLNIEVTGSYQGVQRQNAIHLQLVTPPPPPCPPNNIGCLWQRYQSLLPIILLLLLVLVLLGFVTRPAPFGILESGSYWIVLGRGRSLVRRFFRKSVIPSSELEGSFDFKGALFNLRFKRRRHAYIEAGGDMPSVAVKDENGNRHPVKPGQRMLLSDGSVIEVDGDTIATFKKAVLPEPELDSAY